MNEEVINRVTTSGARERAVLTVEIACALFRRRVERVSQLILRLEVVVERHPLNPIG